jgi:oligoendopeptidase F
MFAEFEKKAHKLYEKGGVLTCESLSAIYMKIQHQFFKKVVKIDDEIALEWARIPHFYTSYYVYKYATGFSAATHLASGILSGDKKKRTAYLNFLKSGGSDYPIELLKKAGVDLSTTEPINAAFDVFEEKLNQFEDLML